MRKPTTPKDFDLPTKLVPGPHHIPPKGRGAEADLRAGKPRGWLTARMQRNGLLIISSVLDRVEDPRSVRYVRNLGAQCLIGSSWHTFAEQAPHMRRRLKLPRLDLLRTQYDPSFVTTAALTKAVQDRLAHDVLPGAENMMTAFRYHAAGVLDNRHLTLGRQLGGTGLLLAAADIGDSVARSPGLEDSEVQTAVRTRSLELIRTIPALAHTLGETPSLAQLAAPDSPLAVMTRETAPDDVHFAYRNALDEFALAA